MNLWKLASAATSPTYWPTLLRRVVPTIEHGPPLRGILPATVIDAGANKGQFSSFARKQWPKAKILAFEPIPDQAARYRQVMGSDATLYSCALGADQGTMELHLASRADSSSLLPLADDQKRLFDMEEIGTIAVPVERLDTILAPADIVGPILLKIDVQGFEYEVLSGISGLTDLIKWIYVETSFIELYKGQRLYSDIVNLLASLNYEYLSKSNVSRNKCGKEIQADILFERIG